MASYEIRLSSVHAIRLFAILTKESDKICQKHLTKMKKIENLIDKPLK